MSVQGDTELRDLVAQTLENAGVLAKIRAELRASVFLVLEEHEAFKGRNLSYTNKPLKDFLATQEGVVVVSLVREFLEYFGLEFTASVFEPETQAGKDYEYVGRNKLAQDLKLNSGKKTPLLAQVLQESKLPIPVAAPTRKDDLIDITFTKEKVKDENKGETNSHATNGLTKNPDSGTRDMNVEKPPSTPHLSAVTPHSPQAQQNHLKKPDSLKLDLGQMNLKPAGSSLSSLGGLPPLGSSPVNQANKVNSNKGSKQVSSDIKALLDFGQSDSPENNYEEDFHPSGSEKTSKGTNSGSEVDEEMSVGIDDLSGSNGSGKSGDS